MVLVFDTLQTLNKLHCAGKYQSLIPWQVLAFCEKKIFVVKTKYWAFLGKRKEFLSRLCVYMCFSISLRYLNGYLYKTLLNPEGSNVSLLKLKKLPQVLY